MKYSRLTFVLAIVAVMFLPQTLSAQLSGQVVNFCLNRYNSATNGAKLPVEEGEILGTIHWRGWSPSDQYQTATAIRTLMTADPDDDNMPARMDFHNHSSDPFSIRRMTILDNGNVGIGFLPDVDPIDLFDVNGDARIRGLRVYLDDPTMPGGGEALTRVAMDCFGAPLPNGNGLALNFGGGFADGVFVDGPGLIVCGELGSTCLSAERHIVSEEGNIVVGQMLDCDDPTSGNFVNSAADGDFRAQGANGDFVAEGDDGDFVAEGENSDFILGVTGTDEGGRALSRANSGGFLGEEILLLNRGGDFTGGVRVDGPGLIVGNMASLTADPADIVDHELAVAGSIIAEEVVVRLQVNWPDYVFSENHQQPTLEEVETFIDKNKHLPGIPSAQEVANDGIEVGDMQVKMMEKIEELYLHIIDMNKQVQELKAENEALKNRLGN